MRDNLLRRSIGALIPLLSSLLVSACTNREIIDPALEVPNKRWVVVMPFKDGDFESGWDSPRGRELATLVTKELQKKGEFKVVPIDRVLELYTTCNPRELTAKQVAKRLDADYVLMGNVVQWQTRDEDMVSPIYKGKSTVEVSVYETAAAAAERIPDERTPTGGRLALSRNRASAIFPHEYGMERGDPDLKEPEVEEGLKNSTATAVAWLLVAHTKDEEKLASGN